MTLESFIFRYSGMSFCTILPEQVSDPLGILIRRASHTCDHYYTPPNYSQARPICGLHLTTPGVGRRNNHIPHSAISP
jgi:hypothetical protein